MTKIPVSKTGEAPELKDGVYAVKCIQVKDDHMDNAQYGNGDVVRLYMSFNDAYDEDNEHIELDAMANRKLSPMSKLTKWAAALGRVIDFDKEVEFDPEELVGSECLATIIHKDAQGWPRIDSLTALPVAGARPSSPALIKATGDIDWTLFWKEIDKAGGTRKGVAEMVGGDLETLTTMEPTKVVELLERVKGAM